MKKELLLSAKNVKQIYPSPSGTPTVILDNINFDLYSREIVGLLGKSGSGKSTILRIVSALSMPTNGTVKFHNQLIKNPDPRIAMVFQNFALFPWMTVMENISIGLQSRGISKDEILKRVSRAINLIGLDGYENNYPRDLSGGMRQRVGIARALVINPEILLMDEPFSALDVLTGEVLKTDLLDIWTEETTSLKAILIVTHNIEEAVMLCDRVMVISSHPGRIIKEIPIKLPHPRDRLSVKFRKIVDQIYESMTHNLQEKAHKDTRVIPNIDPMRIEGLMEKLVEAPFNGHADLPHLASALSLSTDNLFPLIEALQLMKFGEVSDKDVHITASGRLYLEGDTEDRKNIFGRHMVQYVPLAGQLKRQLQDSGNPVTSKSLLENLRKDINEETAKNTIEALKKWGIYSGLFRYDNTKQIFKN